MKKKITITSAMAATILFSSITPTIQAHADTKNPSSEVTIQNDNVQAKTLKDNKYLKEVETRDDKNIYRSTFNKQTNSIEIKTLDLNGTLLNTETFNNPTTNSNVQMAAASSTPIAQKVPYDNYYYRIYSYNSTFIWLIQIFNKAALNPTENSKTSGPLKEFKSSVDAFSANKNQLVAKVGGGILTAIAALWLTPDLTFTKFAALLLSAGAGIYAYSEGKAVYDAYTDSKLAYQAVKNAM